MIILVRLLFWRCTWNSPRDRVLQWAFRCAWSCGKLGRSFRLSVMRLGMERWPMPKPPPYPADDEGREKP